MATKHHPSGAADGAETSHGAIHVVRPGTMAVSGQHQAVFHTPPIGSGVAIALVDPEAPVCGLLYFLMPECAIDQQLRAFRPELFADSGFDLLLHEVERHAPLRDRIRAYVVGGADPMNTDDVTSEVSLGVRNVARAEQLLANANLRIVGARTGGHRCRRIAIELPSGRVRMSESPTVSESQ